MWRQDDEQGAGQRDDAGVGRAGSGAASPAGDPPPWERLAGTDGSSPDSSRFAARPPGVEEEGGSSSPAAQAGPAARGEYGEDYEGPRSYGSADEEDEPGDEEVRQAVYRRMAQDPWVDPSRVQVRVEDGVVTLTGEVDDFMEARYVWDDAWESPGVRGVINHLAVRTDLPRDEPGEPLPPGSGD
jgi:hypothetical protein